MKDMFLPILMSKNKSFERGRSMNTIAPIELCSPKYLPILVNNSTGSGQQVLCLQNYTRFNDISWSHENMP